MKTFPILFAYEDVKDLYPNVTGYYAFINRWMKSGKLKQIKKGLYALVDPSTGYIYANKFQIASHLFDDSYFSYHEALEYYGLANQCFVSIFNYFSLNQLSDVVFQDVSYHSLKNKCNLQIINKINEEGIRVVTLERAIIDSIDNPSLAGGLEEIEYALVNTPKLNIQLVEEILSYYDKAYLYQKVGYLFEKYFGNNITPSFYKLCQAKVGKKTFYFECSKGEAIKNKKWNLMVKKEEKLPNEIF